MQYGPQLQRNREGRGALGISKRCLRRKTTGGVPALESAKSHVGFLGALTGAKGANSAIRSPRRIKQITLKLAVNQGPIRLWRDSALRASAPVSAPYISDRKWLDGNHLLISNISYLL